MKKKELEAVVPCYAYTRNTWRDNNLPVYLPKLEEVPKHSQWDRLGATGTTTKVLVSCVHLADDGTTVVIEERKYAVTLGQVDRVATKEEVVEHLQRIKQWRDTRAYQEATFAAHSGAMCKALEEAGFPGARARFDCITISRASVVAWAEKQEKGGSNA
jgi:hypothetical protein